MTLLLAAENVGLGALFFGVFRGERDLRQRLGIPVGLELLGAVALGYPVPIAPDEAAASNAPASGPGRSAARERRRSRQIIRRGHW
jgi:nitroreductase